MSLEAVVSSGKYRVFQIPISSKLAGKFTIEKSKALISTKLKSKIDEILLENRSYRLKHDIKGKQDYVKVCYNNSNLSVF